MYIRIQITVNIGLTETSSSLLRKLDVAIRNVLSVLVMKSDPVLVVPRSGLTIAMLVANQRIY